MRTLLIAPHALADDESLFASYLAQRFAARVAVVYDEGRVKELSRATVWLGCSYFQLGARKGMDAEQVETYMNGLRDPAGMGDWDRVIAPASRSGGHEEHNLVAEVTMAVFPDTPITWYLTYAPRGERDRRGDLVEPPSSEAIARKLAAMSCYRSQIMDPLTRPWFYDLLDMREWTV